MLWWTSVYLPYPSKQSDTRTQDARWSKLAGNGEMPGVSGGTCIYARLKAEGRNSRDIQDEGLATLSMRYNICLLVIFALISKASLWSSEASQEGGGCSWGLAVHMGFSHHSQERCSCKSGRGRGTALVWCSQLSGWRAPTLRVKYCFSLSICNSN